MMTFEEHSAAIAAAAEALNYVLRDAAEDGFNTKVSVETWSPYTGTSAAFIHGVEINRAVKCTLTNPSPPPPKR